MKNSLKKLFAIFATLLVFAGCGGPAAPGQYAEVAKCLNQKGVIMYGAYWCPHCSAQKKQFGDDFQFVHYQECDAKGVNGDKSVCLSAGVTSYPTWILPGQGSLVGEQQVRDLAKLANCDDKLPTVDQQKLKDEAKAVSEANKAEATTSPTTPTATDITTATTKTPTVTATPDAIVTPADAPATK